MKSLLTILCKLDQIIADPTIEWKSYNVDWVYPQEARVWTEIKLEPLNETIRLCLQKFYPIDNEYEFIDKNDNWYDPVYYHNHPWPKEMYIVKGSVEHGISTTNNPLYYMRHTDINERDMQYDLKNNELAVLEHAENSLFILDNIKTWHYLKPLYGNPVYSIMITYQPWIKGPKAPKEIKEVSIKEQLDIVNTIMDWHKNSIYKIS